MTSTDTLREQARLWYARQRLGRRQELEAQRKIRTCTEPSAQVMVHGKTIKVRQLGI